MNTHTVRSRWFPPCDACVVGQEWAWALTESSLGDQSSTSIEQRAHVVHSLWLLLAKAYGGCGQFLGQACAQGVDGIVTWVCVYLIYHENNTVADVYYGAADNDTESLIRQCHQLMTMQEFSQLSVPLQNDLTFVVEALKGFVGRRHALQTGSRTCLHRHGNPLKIGPSLDAFYEFAARLVKWQKLDCVSNPLSAISTTNDVGTLIPVHCGHNGWMADVNVSQVVEAVLASTHDKEIM